MVCAITKKKHPGTKRGYISALATQPVTAGNKLVVTLIFDSRIEDREVMKAFSKIMAYHRAISPLVPAAPKPQTEAEKLEAAFENIFSDEDTFGGIVDAEDL